MIPKIKEEPNQSIQHNAGSRPSSGDSPASGTPASPARVADLERWANPFHVKTRHFVLLASLIALTSALKAGEMSNLVPTGSIAEAKKSRLFVEELAVSPKQVLYAGQPVRFEEAWIEYSSRTENFLLLFQRRRRFSGYYLCVRMAAGAMISDQIVFPGPFLHCEGSRPGQLFTHFGDGSKDPVAFFFFKSLREEYQIGIAKDYKAHLEAFVSLARPNHAPQHNAGSRPSSMKSPASETPSSLGPRG